MFIIGFERLKLELWKLKTKIDFIRKEDESEEKSYRAAYMVDINLAKDFSNDLNEYMTWVDNATKDLDELARIGQERNKRILKELEEFNKQLPKTVGWGL